VSPGGTVPLERALSKLGLATRTQARALIVAGHVTVDGRITLDPLVPVVPERAQLAIHGQRVSRAEPITIALHKPRGVVTTRRDPEGRKTVYDFVSDLDAHVVPVGRLDYATSGLLLMSNDTRLADWLTDPVNAVSRLYLVSVRGRVRDDAAASLVSGVRDGTQLLRAQSVEIQKASGRESHLLVELVEGKNREVRRLMAAIGHEVIRLRRVQFGGLTIGDLAPGTWRRLNHDELAHAFPGAPLSRLQRARGGG
jgi:23S rRNA pseudouridine2605 synthase